MDDFTAPESTYTPNPDAARILSQAIQFGYAPDPLPNLPPEWFHALAAVLDVIDSSQRVRWQTFVSSIKGFPYEMVEEVADCMEEVVDRTEKDRVLYTSKDGLHPPPPLRWCVEGVFAQPSLNLLVGDPGTKKTYLAIDLAVCVAMGKPWLAHSVNRCPVLLIDEESGLYQLWARVNAALCSHGADSSTPFDYISLGGYDFRDSADADKLIHRAISRGSGLIIIDALSNLMRTGDSSMSSVQPVLFNLRRMAEFCRAAVLVIHHTNRHGVFRGSSAISAAVDLMLSIKSSPTDSLIELQSLKARFSAPQPFCARAIFETHVPRSGEAATWGTPDGQEHFHLEPSDEKPLSLAPSQPFTEKSPGVIFCILEFLAEHQGATRADLTSSLTSYSPGTIRNALHRLMVSGLISKVKSQEKPKAPGYQLSEKGVDFIDD